MEAPPFAVPSTLGRCVGMTLIGYGAMGAVFQAHHTDLGREVAVKVLNPKVGRTDPRLLQRFVREVRLCLSIRDPHVVEVFDAGQDEGLTYVVMELISGRSLGELLHREEGQRFAPVVAAHYLLRIARGLVAIHGEGIVHRDLKPDNVMVSDEGQTKIADFGLARGEDSTQLTMECELLGTPGYMAPEMILNDVVGAPADLYSLGVIAYKLLTGEPPFAHPNVMQLLRMHARDTPKPLGPKVSGLAPAVAEAVAKLLSKDPAERPTAADLIGVFEPFAVADPPHRVTDDDDEPLEFGLKAVVPAEPTPPPAPAPAPAPTLAPAPPPAPAGATPAGATPAGATPPAPTPASGAVLVPARFPTWGELAILERVSRDGAADLDALVAAGPQWCRQPGMTYVQFLIHHGQLDGAAGRQAWAEAGPALAAFRADLGGDEAPLNAMAEASVRTACAQLQQTPGPLPQLAQKLRPEAFEELYRRALKLLIQRLRQKLPR